MLVANMIQNYLKQMWRWPKREWPDWNKNYSRYTQMFGIKRKDWIRCPCKSPFTQWIFSEGQQILIWMFINVSDTYQYIYSIFRCSVRQKMAGEQSRYTVEQAHQILNQIKDIRKSVCINEQEKRQLLQVCSYNKILRFW